VQVKLIVVSAAAQIHFKPYCAFAFAELALSYLTAMNVFTTFVDLFSAFAIAGGLFFRGPFSGERIFHGPFSVDLLTADLFT
jgi:hypothetical protein